MDCEERMAQQVTLTSSEVSCFCCDELQTGFAYYSCDARVAVPWYDRLDLQERG